MSVWRVVSSALAALWLGGAAMAGPPERVVSINLCTDQLAMLLAAPGQLISVSHLAQDPRSSAMAAEAAGWQANRGKAEDVYLLAPDLVLAGSHTTPATVQMLRRLGIAVEVFSHAAGFADVTAQLLRMGAVLGREAAAAEAVARFEADLAAIATDPAADAPRAALYQAGGWSSGRASLPGEVLAAAGLANVAEELGLSAGGFVPLEVLILAAPDLVVSGRPWAGASRAEERAAHPALRDAGRASAALTDRDWVCGLPHLLGPVAAMAELRRKLQAGE